MLMRGRARSRRWGVAAAVLVLVLAGCGADEDAVPSADAPADTGTQESPDAESGVDPSDGADGLPGTQGGRAEDDDGETPSAADGGDGRGGAREGSAGEEDGAGGDRASARDGGSTGEPAVEDSGGRGGASGGSTTEGGAAGGGGAAGDGSAGERGAGERTEASAGAETDPGGDGTGEAGGRATSGAGTDGGAGSTVSTEPVPPTSCSYRTAGPGRIRVVVELPDGLSEFVVEHAGRQHGPFDAPTDVPHTPGADVDARSVSTDDVLSASRGCVGERTRTHRIVIELGARCPGAGGDGPTVVPSPELIGDGAVKIEACGGVGGPTLLEDLLKRVLAQLEADGFDVLPGVDIDLPLPRLPPGLDRGGLSGIEERLGIDLDLGLEVPPALEPPGTIDVPDVVGPGRPGDEIDRGIVIRPPGGIDDGIITPPDVIDGNPFDPRFPLDPSLAPDAVPDLGPGGEGVPSP